MSVAQLKALIEEHGHSHVDCPELSGLRDRAREAIASSHQTSAGSDDRDDDESASHRESAAEEDEGPSEPPPQAPDEPTPEDAGSREISMSMRTHQRSVVRTPSIATMRSPVAPTPRRRTKTRISSPRPDSASVWLLRDRPLEH